MRAVLVSALALSGTAALAACAEESAGPERGVTFQEVVEDRGDELVGQTVTLSARVDEVIAPSTFYLGEDTDERLLVVGAETVEPEENVIVDGSYVEVTGEVRDFNTTEVASESGGAVQDDELETTTEENYLLAQEVELLSEPG